MIRRGFRVVLTNPDIEKNRGAAELVAGLRAK